MGDDRLSILVFVQYETRNLSLVWSTFHKVRRIGFSLTRRFVGYSAIITPQGSSWNVPFFKELKRIPEVPLSYIRTSVSFLERISTYVFILLRGANLASLSASSLYVWIVDRDRYAHMLKFGRRFFAQRRKALPRF